MHAILHDLRLAGAAPAADYNLVVNASTRLTDALARLRAYALAQTGPITLDIMCHGFESHNDYVHQQTVVDGIGGGGLQLCRENLRHTNVQHTGELNGVVSLVTVYACSAAETAPGYSGTSRDGQRLFREMAHYTGANIRAADATQWYWRNRVSMPGACAERVIDFRGWDGNLYEFSPDGTVVMLESHALGTPR